jgi:hypothetical protein
MKSLKKDLIALGFFGVVAYIFLIPLSLEHHFWIENVGFAFLISVIVCAVLGAINKKKQPVQIRLHTNRATRRALQRSRK